MAELDLGDFVRCMDPVVREAAAIARGFEGRVTNQPKSDEKGAVKQALTEADTACQEAILQGLLEHFPEVSLAAEEDTPSVARFSEGREALVVIDPIDGTLHSYLEASGPYAVIVGLARRGVLESSLVALPREGLFFAASRGRGAGVARPNGPHIPIQFEPANKRILVSHSLPRPAIEFLDREGFETIPACGGAVAVAPLIPWVRAGIRYASSGIGISIRGRVGALIAAEAGACVRAGSGEPFPLDLTTPTPALLVSGTPEDQAVLQAALAEIDPV